MNLLNQIEKIILKSQNIKFNILAGSLSICLLIALWIISNLVRSHTSFYYDEVFDLVANYGVPNNCKNIHAVTNLSLSIGCIPIQSGVPYVGAVRTFLLFPFIKMGLLTPATMTFIMLIIYLFSFFIMQKIMLTLGIGVKVRISVTLLFYCSPFVWLNSAFDFGPNSIQLLLRTILLAEIYRQLMNPERGFVRILIYSGLLIWGKLDSLFFLLFPIAILTFNALTFQKLSKKSRLGLYAVIVLYLGSFAYAINISEINSENIVSQVTQKIFITIPYNLIYSVMPILYPNQTPENLLIYGRIFLSLLIFLTIIQAISSFNRYLKLHDLKALFYFICSVATLGVIASISLVSNATAPWHTFAIFPSAILIIVKSINDLLQKMHFARIMFKILLVPSLILVLFLNLRFFQIEKSEISPRLSKKFIEMVDSRIKDFKIESGDAVAFVNWGDYNRVLLTRKTSDPIVSDLWDVWPWFDGERDIKIIDNLNWISSSGPWSRYSRILFIQSSRILPGMKSSIVQELELENWKMERVSTLISDGINLNFVLMEKLI